MSNALPATVDPYEKLSIQFSIPRCRRSALPATRDQLTQFVERCENGALCQRAAVRRTSTCRAGALIAASRVTS